MPKKTWSTLIEPRGPDDKIIFELNGELFECLDDIPSGAFRSISSWATAAGSALGFIEACLVDDDNVIRFRIVTDSKLQVVPKETPIEIMNWLISQYADRPTQSPSHSAPGSAVLNGGSVGDSSSIVRSGSTN